MGVDVEYRLAANCWEDRKTIGGVAKKDDVEGRVTGAAMSSPNGNPIISPLTFQAASGNCKAIRGVDEALFIEKDWE